MALSNNFLDLTFDGMDWLDKPHFQFWVTAVSFKIFGINTFAYKIPAILFTMLALFYTYRLTRDLYNRETALLAVLILATAQHLIISNNDVRAEPMLTGLIIASIYQYHRLVQRYHWTSLLWASLFAALSVMTKGLVYFDPNTGGCGRGDHHQATIQAGSEFKVGPQPAVDHLVYHTRVVCPLSPV